MTRKGNTRAAEPRPPGATAGRPGMGDARTSTPAGELRDNLTPYDAAYVALAELTGAVLVTGDERITASPGTRCEIQVIK